MVEGEPTKRKRGAPPGNTNALKHGFYSSRFREIEASDLEAYLAGGLQDEIAGLRVSIRRLLEWSDEAESLDQAVHALNAVGVNMSRLAGLLKAQKALGYGQVDVAAALSEALAAVLDELRSE